MWGEERESRRHTGLQLSRAGEPHFDPVNAARRDAVGLVFVPGRQIEDDGPGGGGECPQGIHFYCRTAG